MRSAYAERIFLFYEIKFYKIKAICVIERGKAMRYLLDHSQMQQCDHNTMEHFGMLSAVLMERAALAVVDEIQKRVPQENKKEPAGVLVVCGAGNNGGDGFAAARLLFLKGYQVKIWMIGNPEKMSVECARQYQIVQNYGIPVETEASAEEVKKCGADVIIDAVFGIGLSRPVSGRYADCLEILNQMPGYKVAVDICSGLSADDGSVMGIAFRADLTVTFGFAKVGHVLYPGAEYSGEVVVCDMGIDTNSLLDVKPDVFCMEPEDLCMLPRRSAHSNKGTYGKLLIFAGSENMAGAAVFSARAACAAGTGLVRIFTEDCNRSIVQTLIPEAVLTTWKAEEEEEELEVKVSEALSWAGAVVLGPGLGTSDGAQKLVHMVLKQIQVPCVVDADALNILAGHKEWLSDVHAPVILTPHLGEMARLSGNTIPEIQKSLLMVARCFAKEYNVITVLKDARTVTALPDGTAWINCNGNDGMATAGSGDVLTGVIGALLAQRCEPGQAAPLGVYLHAMAGDYAAAEVGKRGLMASDICTGIKNVLKEG